MQNTGFQNSLFAFIWYGEFINYWPHTICFISSCKLPGKQLMTSAGIQKHLMSGFIVGTLRFNSMRLNRGSGGNHMRK